MTIAEDRNLVIKLEIGLTVFVACTVLFLGWIVANVMEGRRQAYRAQQDAAAVRSMADEALKRAKSAQREVRKVVPHAPSESQP